MRIAQIAPMYEAVPPRLYGGTERVVAHLTDALVRQGHEVTLFFPRQMPERLQHSSLPGRNRCGSIRASSSRTWLVIYLCCTQCAAGRDRFDVLHFHIDMFPIFEESADTVKAPFLQAAPSAAG
jgi:glycosyltransferase involved in cell wall biosynthesis